MTSILIDSPEAFGDLCHRMKTSPFVAIDTEFMRNKTYWAQLCLLQIADKDNKNAAVVDCLASDMDLSPLADILRDPNIVKVFHAARQDVEILYKQFGFIPAPLFDTQVAAMACGLGDQIGYDVLVKKTVGAQVDKTSRFKDWRKRPLSKADIDYAAGDVLHLTHAYEWVRDYLGQENRESWIKDEMAKLCNEDSYRSDPEWAWLKLKVKGSNMHRSILRELATLREREAQRRNLPRAFILKDEVIYGLVSTTPGDYQALKEATALYGKQYKGDFAGRILEAIQRGITLAHKLPDIKVSKKKSGSPTALEVLKMILKMSSETHNVAARLVADGEDLARMSSGDYEGLRTMQGWRYEIFGKCAEDFLKGRLSLSLQDGRLCLNPITGE